MGELDSWLTEVFGALQKVLRAHGAVEEAAVVEATVAYRTRSVISFLCSNQDLGRPWSCQGQVLVERDP